MNITYIIGNGFDLGLGLNTTYSNFVDFLSERVKRWLSTNEKSWNRDEMRFAEWLEGKIVENKFEFWHDAEEAFGALSFSAFSERDGRMDCHEECAVFSPQRRGIENT